MERLTTNKPVSEMGMYELAHNSCYIGEDRATRYRDFDTDIDARDFARKLMVAFGQWKSMEEYGLDADNELVDNDIFDDSMLELLAEDNTTITGLIALFYRNLWAMSELREKLKQYEDLEEQGFLLKQPCEVGSTVYVITTCKDFGKVLDGTLWGEDGGFGTATGYYCPYELSDYCPHEDGFEECEGGCECFENKLAVFEDCIECITVWEHETVVFLINCGSVSFEDFGKTVFLTKEEAEAALKEMEK